VWLVHIAKLLDIDGWQSVDEDLGRAMWAVAASPPSAGSQSRGTLTVESAPFTCHAHYLVDKTYTVTLGQVGRADPVRLKSVPVRRDGAFRTSVRIPRTASPGQSFIVVKGSLFDRCRDTASCAGYTAPVRVLAPS
jgi:hypothetical protein